MFFVGRKAAAASLAFVLVFLFVYSQSPPKNMELGNPSAEYCVDNGYEYKIRTSEDGSQFGVCIFPDDSECPSWAYFRGDCPVEEVLESCEPYAGIAVCSTEYRPVCAKIESGWATKSNPCVACVEPAGTAAKGYKAGECSE